MLLQRKEEKMLYLIFTWIFSILVWLNNHAIVTAILFIIAGWGIALGDEIGNKIGGVFFIFIGIAMLSRILF